MKKLMITEDEVDSHLRVLKDVLAQVPEIEDCARDLETSVEHSTATEDIGDNLAYIICYVELVIKELTALKKRADRQYNQAEISTEEIDYKLRLLNGVLAHAMEIEDYASYLEFDVEQSAITGQVRLVIKELTALKNRAEAATEDNIDEVNENATNHRITESIMLRSATDR